MIKNAKLLAVSTAVSVLALTACGGGGGSDDGGVAVNQPTKPATTPTRLEIDGGAVNIKDTKIYGKINGNTFAGERNNVSTEGKFFGPNAETIGGTYHDKNQKLHGSFSASSAK